MFILILSLFMIMLSLAILMNQGLREKKFKKYLIIQTYYSFLL
jgi:hypothetical protein